MAGMAKRGTHTARHRAGRARPDAAGPDAPQSAAEQQDAPPPRRLRPEKAWPDAPAAHVGGSRPGAVGDQGFPVTAAPRPDPPVLDLPAASWPVPSSPREADLGPEVRGSDGMARAPGPDADIGYEAMAWNGGGPSQPAPAVMPPPAPDRQAQPQPQWPPPVQQSPVQQPPVRPAPVRPPPVRPAPPPQKKTGPAGGGPAGRSSKYGRRSRRTAIRATALFCAVAVVVIAVTGIRPAGASVTASVKSFLFDWQQKNYAAAAAMTTGDPAVVASSLRSVYRQLGAEDLLLTMGPISVRGDRARASFSASFDLGRGGLSWHYTGSFRLRRNAAGWQVVWSPSVAVPGLGSGDRLAVLTTMPQRAVPLDAQGHSLIRKSAVVEVGVIPDKVHHPLRTAQRLARVTGLAPSDADEMSGQIEAAPPRHFLELVQLSPRGYRRIRHELRKVPGLRHKWVRKRLFETTVPVITGQVATETAKTLIDEGEPYRPGTTVGLSGLQQAYQAKLAGKPTTEILVQDAKGKQVKVLHRWLGSPGSDVRTTISTPVQMAAKNALTGVGLSAVIIAVRAGGGQILAVATHTKHGAPAVSPLDGQYHPGQSFTIVSTAALLASTSVNAKTPEPCYRRNSVSQGQANVPQGTNLGSQPTFRDVFAHACSTAFRELSLVLTSRQLTSAAEKLGIGGPAWKLPLPAFPGRMSSPGNDPGELAADTVGTGSVLVSPLDMALVAGAVESGTWRAPLLVTGSLAQRPTRPRLGFSVAKQLRDLMRFTVKSGAAQAANVPDGEVFGQVGAAPLPGHRDLRAIWFVGFRGKVAFAVVVFARSASFSPAVQIAGRFAAGLPSGS